MGDGAAQLALRELRAQFSDRRVGAGVLGVGAILGLIGPFDTSDTLRLVPRAAYWVAITAATYASGSLVSAVVFRATASWPVWARLGASAVLNGLAVTVIVVTLNAAVFALRPDGAGVLELALIASVISAIIFALSLVLTQATPGERRPALLDRLPPERRGALLALSVEDHYVRVRTEKGEALLLMRLSDAIRETGDIAGDQVHRSHWVAWAAVTRVARKGDRAVLSLTSGDDIPVSRANISKLKDAGLLPR